MNNLTGLQDIRKEFLDFFESKGHLVHKSYSLIPQDDDSLLLIGAGMAPIKKYFTGEVKPPRKRMATCQKCMRTGDLENVGVTARHATFFEMLGNFSFGDYFKREAIHWAWEFLTENMGISEDILWISVYLDDDEAVEIWNKEIGVPMERIVRLGKEDNFWELEVGPSGPCSEIFIDRGRDLYDCDNPDCKPGAECDCDRFLEVWNLVFTQYDKDENNNYTPLKDKNIDTGMGLERIAAYKQGAENIYEIKEHQKVIREIEKISGYKYGTDEKKDIAVRVIVDHSKAAAFMVSDTIIPSNEGRGYVLRRLIRRAARFGRLLDIEGSFLESIVQCIIDEWHVGYPELRENQDRIKQVIHQEEDRFAKTIDQGINILKDLIKGIVKKKLNTLSGEDAFKLYDTYGFPLELTEEILNENGLKVAIDEFKYEMEKQRTRAREALKAKDGSEGWAGNDLVLDEDLGETKFTGYNQTADDIVVESIFVGEEAVEKIGGDTEGILILSSTPFYPEGGGQIGDTGIIVSPDFKFIVKNTIKNKKGTIMHIGTLYSGEINSGDKGKAKVFEDRRNAIKRNHSGTHLLHAALKNVLGDHINQAGSEVSDKRMRFDFSHFEGVTEEELGEIEKLVNEYIYSETEGKVYTESLEDALSSGALGLFEDAYGDSVRIVEYPGISKELCGGIHVDKTSDIGMFKILSESGIAAGVRRIEATTGTNVYEMLNNLERDRDDLANILKVNNKDINSSVSSLLEENRKLNKELNDLRRKNLQDNLDSILDNVVDIDGVNLITYRVDDQKVDILRDLADQVQSKVGSGIVVIGTSNGDKVNFVATVSDDLIEKGYKAGDIVSQVAKITGGGGGGRPGMATAGGRDVSKLDTALEEVQDIIKEIV